MLCLFVNVGHHGGVRAMSFATQGHSFVQKESPPDGFAQDTMNLVGAHLGRHSKPDSLAASEPSELHFFFFCLHGVFDTD